MPDRSAALGPIMMPDILKCAEAAARAIPPAFPLDATVAVNPFLGQTGEDLATASARLARVAGVRLTRPRSAVSAEVTAGRIADDDLVAALAASSAVYRPAGLAELKARLSEESACPQALPTIADLACSETGIDWPSVIQRAIGLWASGRFDRGQALWMPAAGRSAFAAWREWATHDLTPEIAGLEGFCAHVADAPDSAERAIVRAADRLGISGASGETVFHRLLVDLGGWAQHARWLAWEAGRQGRTDSTLIDLLAIRLVFEEALLAHLPAVTNDWEAALAAHAAPVAPTPDMVIDAILQEAAERAQQRKLAERLTGIRSGPGRPRLQAVFCIDVRSEVFRRALESVDPEIETLGFAGFFGLPVSYRAQASDVEEAHLPVLLRPILAATSHATAEAEQAARISARALRAWDRFRQAAVSSFAFVEAAGAFYGWKLVKTSLGLDAAVPAPSPEPRLEPALSSRTKVATAASILRAMGLTDGFAPTVLLVGHGARVANNPHESAYHCGACGGHTGEASARLLAGLLNDPETRAGLAAHGIDIPAGTVFLAGLHDTTTDRVSLFASGHDTRHAVKLGVLRQWLSKAGAIARAERALRLPAASPQSLMARAVNWAEIRPEWGLAGCASFIAAPRTATAGTDFAGRTFLHSYDWRADSGFATLELILTAPVVVASWISLQYYGSSVAPGLFGSGNKLIHNVAGGIGVLQGNGGMLHAGLPWQAVHDGERLIHEPLRLSVLIEAPPAAIAGILARHDDVRALFDNGWLHLLALEDGRISARYRPGLVWEDAACLCSAAA